MGVVTRLHSRACQTMGEIIALLKAGYADGAMARWRTLHEISVILNFIVENGEDVAIKYADHKAIHIYKSAKEYCRYYERLGYEPMTEEEFSAVRTDYEKQIEKYGAPFKNDYGWAAEALNMTRPTFRDMEEAVKLDHFHTYYGFACHSVHCDSKGTFSRVGVSADNSPVLVGPSVFGLIDPISCSSISLVQTTMPLLCFESTLDSYISCRILVLMLDKISQTLCAIDDTNQSVSD